MTYETENGYIYTFGNKTYKTEEARNIDSHYSKKDVFNLYENSENEYFLAYMNFYTHQNEIIKIMDKEEARAYLVANNRDTWKLDPRSKKHSKPTSETGYCLVTYY